MRTDAGVVQLLHPFNERGLESAQVRDTGGPTDHDTPIVETKESAEILDHCVNLEAVAPQRPRRPRTVGLAQTLATLPVMSRMRLEAPARLIRRLFLAGNPTRAPLQPGGKRKRRDAPKDAEKGPRVGPHLRDRQS